ncbi:MAG: EAL domain-containing protein [Wenzhouxiangella sp.]|nr:EAL domain-containing protein [Wenzhouxiangella sp.]
MSAPRRFGSRRYRRYLVAWGLLGVASALVALLLYHQHKSNVDNLLAHSLSAQQISWNAVQALQRNSVSTYLEQYVNQPRTLDLLRAAQSPDTREQSRAELFELLQPAFRNMTARGIGVFHFHLPDGESLLRFHSPEHFGDGLIPVRESIRLVNTQLEPVHGFEAGRLLAGYRSVYPIVDSSGLHLGSVEFSLPFPILLAELKQLVPGRVFQVLLDRSLQRDILFDGLKDRYPTWPGSEQFLVASSEGREASRVVDRLAHAVGRNPALRAVAEARASSASRVEIDGVDFVMTLEPMVDPGGAVVGLLLSYAPETALTHMDQAFRLNLLLAGLGLLLLGVGAHQLIRFASDKFAERERLDLITRSLGQGMYALDAQGVVTEVNPRACTLLGYAPEELIGQKAHELFHTHLGDPRDDSLPCPILAATSRGERFTGEQRFRCRGGRGLEVSLTSVPLSEQEGSVTLFDDISRQKENERKLHTIAHYDALTGLPNRVLLSDRLALAMARARRSRTPLVLAFVDLDGFKAVNDTHGHNAGDRLLVELARRMQNCLRETDTVARLGGDEFAVVMTDLSDLASYTRLLDRLLVALAVPERIEGNEVQVSASIGVSLYPQRVEIDADQLLRQADQAMYEAKLAGKNRYRVFDVDRDSELRGRHEHAEQLRRGMDRDELLLYFQPKVNMRTGDVLGAEALIRWQHPEQGLLLPAAFLPLISRHSLEVDLGRWVLRRALAQMKIWKSKGLKLPISVNISGDHLQHPDFFKELVDLLAGYPELNPSDLQLEVIESSALEDMGAVSEVIARCSELGVEVALDDFGTGYSSLTSLKRLPVRVLKLDRSFVRDMPHDLENLAILDGVLNLARAFGLQAIAEGVATLQHGRLLLQLGCEAAQGFAIARPMPAVGVASWVEQWRLPEFWSDVAALDRRGLEALYAEVEHRAWMQSLIAYCKDAAADPPDLRDPRARLQAFLRSAPPGSQSREMARHLLGVYPRLSRVADEMIRTRNEQSPHEALALLSELEPLHERCLALLQRLALSTPAQSR